MFRIKYGYAIYWNKVAAQAKAYRELRRFGSAVRAPAVYYVFNYDYMTFIVMEYIPGNTVGKCLEDAD